MIDPRAVVHENAKLHPSVKVAPYAIIGANVEIGEGTTVGASAVIDGHTTIGRDCRIFPHAAVGLEPQDLKYAGEKTTLTVGDRTVIREFATLNTGTEGGGGRSAVGDDCLLMTYSHVAHDCIVGNNVVMANSATLAGHVFVKDYVIIGGLTAIHQFVTLGEHSMIGGCSAVVMDIAPYVIAAGNRAENHGLNLVGLKRRGFSRDSLSALRRVYKTIFRSTDPMAGLIEQVCATEDKDVAEVKRLIEFIQNSKRGVTR
jgi:UDP-N-acetylglucosamine acyltransferase